jgi:hypothetical protein
MRFGSKGPNHSQRNAKKKFLLSRVLEEKWYTANHSDTGHGHPLGLNSKMM